MKILTLCAASLTLTGCALVGLNGGHSSRDISLSDAMESSASGSKEPLHGSDTHESYGFDMDTETSVAGSTASSDGGMDSLVSYGSASYQWQVPFDAASVVPLNGDIEGITKYSLTAFSFEDKRNMFGLYFSGGVVDYHAGSLPDRATRDPWLFEIGTGYRRYLNDPHAFFSPYVSANVSIQGLHWTYRNPVYVGNDTIRTDTLSAFGGYAGLGIAIWRRHPLSLFAEAGFGATVFVNETYEGFHNDVFDNFGYFTVKAGLTLKF